MDIFGRVQGVGFRQFVKKKADAHALTGFVRNRPDGSVLIVAQGSRTALQHFLLEVQQGSMLAKVTRFSYLWHKQSNNYQDFVIAVNSGFIQDQKSSFTNLVGSFFSKSSIPDGNL